MGPVATVAHYQRRTRSHHRCQQLGHGTASGRQRHRTAALAGASSVEVRNEVYHRCQDRETTIDQSQQERMRSTTRAARSSHSRRVNILAGCQYPIGHQLRPQHLNLLGIGCRVGLDPQLMFRLAPSHNIHIDSHRSHAGKGRHAILLIRPITSLGPMACRRDDQRMFPAFFRWRVDRAASIESGKGFEGKVLGRISRMLDRFGRENLRILHGCLQVRLQIENGKSLLAHHASTLLPRGLVGIFGRKPSQQFFAIGRRTTMVLIGLDTDLTLARPLQIERTGHLIQRLG